MMQKEENFIFYLHYITLIYWRKLSPIIHTIRNLIILPFTRLKNKIESRSWVSWVVDRIFLYCVLGEHISVNYYLPLHLLARKGNIVQCSVCLVNEALRACALKLCFKTSGRAKVLELWFID